MRTISERRVESMSNGANHIFYHREHFIGGIFIVYVHSVTNRQGIELWKEFLKRTEGPIYFCVDDPSYIGNHCKFHGNYGGNKVYQYVRA
jgi:hypothetical protein